MAIVGGTEVASIQAKPYGLWVIPSPRYSRATANFLILLRLMT